MGFRNTLALSLLIGLALVGAMAPCLMPAGAAAKRKVLISSSVFRQQTSREDIRKLEAAAPGVQLVLTKDEKEAIEKASDAEGVIGYCSLELLNAAPQLKWVQVRSAGVNDLLFENPPLQDALIKRNITLTNARTLYAPEIADHAFGLLLSLTRGIAEYVRRSGTVEWKKSDHNPLAAGIRPVELKGKTMLIIGFGGIGSQIARRAAAFDMKIYATDPKEIKKPAYIERIAKPVDFHKLLPKADVLVSAVPLTKLTLKMIGKPEFAMMKKHAILINISRGKVVDTDALVEALKTKKIAAAGLDVVDPEPLPLDHPLWKLNNVVISPHVAVQSQNAKGRLFTLVRENLLHFARREPFRNVVDKQAGY